MSRTVYLTSLSIISSTFDTMSPQDADFGLPGFSAFSIDSSSRSVTKVSANICYKEQPILEQAFM